MKNRSIVIFGKGPSLLKCPPDLIDDYDDIAIVNYPVYNSFFKNLIKNREIKYHFANCGTFDDRYTNTFNEKLKIKGVYNTNKARCTYYWKYLRNSRLFRGNVREIGLKYLSERKFNFDPSSGTHALIHILSLNMYNKICLVGFDCFQTGKKMYYYDNKELSVKIQPLIYDKTISTEGNLNIISGHNTEETIKYYEFEIKNNPEIKFIIYGDIKSKFTKEYHNLIIG